MKVRKRNGSLVDFKIQNIIIAIERAMDDTKLGIDHNLSLEIAEK
ncbi:ATP cone domain [Clostridium fallax]|nr:ATP cone domain-containing protein [Clostridium fallax]SQB03629.1 ATP cone domain [Clostridium fallax]